MKCATNSLGDLGETCGEGGGRPLQEKTSVPCGPERGKERTALRTGRDTDVRALRIMACRTSSERKKADRDGR